MDLTGSERIAAPREEVWRALNDPEVLRQCIPGCQEFVRTSPTEFASKVVLKIGPVKATFSSIVTLSELDPPGACHIHGEGQGGVAGFAKGGAKIVLVEEAGETVLHYEAHASVGGKIAQLGARLIEGTSKKLAAEFFGAFGKAVAPGAPAEPA